MRFAKIVPQESKTYNFAADSLLATCFACDSHGDRTGRFPFALPFQETQRGEHPPNSEILDTAQIPLRFAVVFFSVIVFLEGWTLHSKRALGSIRHKPSNATFPACPWKLPCSQVKRKLPGFIERPLWTGTFITTVEAEVDET